MLRKLSRSEQIAVCEAHPHAALHVPRESKQKQFYELIERDRASCNEIYPKVRGITDWETAPTFSLYRKELLRDLGQTRSKVVRHPKQCLMISKGVYFRGRYYIIHVYKFDNASTVKSEVGIPLGHEGSYESVLEMTSEALLCLEQIVPSNARSKSPWDQHTHDFTLVRDLVR